MNDTVWKFEIVQPNAVSDGQYKFSIWMPDKAEILCVKSVNGSVFMWAKVNPNNKQVRRKIYSVGTGFGKVANDSVYIGTVVVGSYVWHIFE
jgi:hypothetical protein